MKIASLSKDQISKEDCIGGDQGESLLIRIGKLHRSIEGLSVLDDSSTRNSVKLLASLVLDRHEMVKLVSHLNMGRRAQDQITLLILEISKDRLL